MILRIFAIFAFALSVGIGCQHGTVATEQFSIVHMNENGTPERVVSVETQTYARSCRHSEVTESGDFITYQRQAESPFRAGAAATVLPSIVQTLMTIVTGPLEAIGLIDPPPLPESEDKNPPTCLPGGREPLDSADGLYRYDPPDVD